MAKKSKEEYEVSDHQLSISSLSLLIRLFWRNRIDKQFTGRVAKILVWALLTQPFQWLQKLLIWPKLRLVDFFREPPTFVIGHWRSGTTHLHYILSRDPQFGYLTNYQALFMRISFVGKGVMDRVLDHFMPETRPQDNITLTAYEPAEEEQPFSNMTIRTGLHSWYFPRNQTYFNKYNLFLNVRKREKAIWHRKYRYMLKLISLANGNRPLLLKNPHNTSRVRELLEIFPRARFIFIHRHPFDVFLSTRHLYERVISSQVLQSVSDEQVLENILHYYKATMQKYLEDRHLIPEGQLVEMSFNELDADPSRAVKRIYESLGIPGYAEASPKIQAYLESVKDYQKNVFPEPEEAMAERLYSEWKFAFEAWGYPKHREALTRQ